MVPVAKTELEKWCTLPGVGTGRRTRRRMAAHYSVKIPSQVVPASPFRDVRRTFGVAEDRSPTPEADVLADVA